MPLEDLTGAARVSPFTQEDRISHMEKMVQRVFGVEAAQLGTIEVVEDRPILVIEHGGKTRRLTWRRNPRGAIQWYADDSDTPLRLSGGNNPLERLRQELDRT